MIGWFLSPIWSSSSFPDPRRNDFGRWGKSTRTRTTFLPGTIGVFSWTWSMGGGGNQVGDAPLYSALYSSSMTHTRWKRNEWKCLHKLSPVSLELFDPLPGSWFTEEPLPYYYFIIISLPSFASDDLITEADVKMRYCQRLKIFHKFQFCSPPSTNHVEMVSPGTLFRAAEFLGMTDTGEKLRSQAWEKLPDSWISL